MTLPCRHKFPLQPCLFVLIWMTATATGLYFRLYPLRTFATHASMEKASVLVVNNLRAKVRGMIEQGFPTAPKARRQQMIRDRVNEILHTDAEQVRRSIRDLARSIDEESGHHRSYPYLLASDSYYYYRLTEKILEQGSISRSFKGSKYFNELMLAPEGHWEPFNLHPYVGFLVFKVLRLFHPGVPLMEAVSFTPLVVTALTLVFFLMICFRLNMHWAVSLTGTTTFALAPIFLKRSAFGWYDNDPYNTLFPLMILSLLFSGLRRGNTPQGLVLSAGLTILTMVLYALFWHGWMFLASLILLSGIGLLLGQRFVFRSAMDIRNTGAFFGIILAGILGGITIIFGPGEFFTLFREGWSAINDFFKPQLSLWPDLYVGVSELHKTSGADLIELTGGYAAYGIAAAGIIGHLFYFTRRRHPDRLYPFVMAVIFMLAAFVMSLQAQRFALLTLVPLSLLFVLGLQVLWELYGGVLAARPWPRRWKTGGRIAGVAVMIGSLLIPVGAAGRRMPDLLNIIYNDTWQTALTGIRERTPADSIINSWWPPGHFITAVARRKVTFDGASINKHQSYWMARILMSTGEREALGLLRMLNDSGNRAVAYLQESGFSLSDAVRTLGAITPLSRRAAEKRLGPLITRERIRNLLALTHAPPPPSYLLIYNELVEKNIQLGFVADWDFKKIEQIEESPTLRRDFLSGSREYVRQVWAMEGGAPKYSGVLAAAGRIGPVILFDGGVRIDTDGLRCMVDSGKYGHGVPHSLLALKDGALVEKKFPEGRLAYSAVLFRTDDTWACALMDTKLARSLLMRLYFFGGHGFRYIRPFISEADLTRRTRIEVFQIDWEKFLKDINESLGDRSGSPAVDGITSFRSRTTFPSNVSASAR